MPATKSPATSRKVYFNLVKSIGFSDFKVKYNASVLGYFWSLGKPLLLFSILYVVFTRFLHIGAGVQYYSIQLLLGIIIWNYFSEATLTCMNSLVSKGGLLRKIYFPREIIILASGFTSFLTLLLNLAVLPVFMYFKHVPVSWEIVLVIPLLVELFLFTIGLALLLSALFVKFRDIGHIWEVSLQGLFYATPIVYSLNSVPERFRGLLMCNPMAQIIQDLRHVMITPTAVTSSDVLHNGLQFIPYLLALLVLIVGVAYFNRSSKSFAEEV